MKRESEIELEEVVVEYCCSLYTNKFKQSRDQCDHMKWRVSAFLVSR